jgi:hypothetical protein
MAELRKPRRHRMMRHGPAAAGSRARPAPARQAGDSDRAPRPGSRGPPGRSRQERRVDNCQKPARRPCPYPAVSRR